MKTVLRHRLTGRYYSKTGRWVRRADNAMVFEAAADAQAFSLEHHLDQAQPVQRLAPYMMSLLSQPAKKHGLHAARRSGAYWYLARVTRFSSN